MRLSVLCPSMGSHEEAVSTWAETSHTELQITVDSTTTGPAAGFLTKCQRFYERDSAPIQGYLHADLYIQDEGWDQRVMDQFGDPAVGVVGFVGARRLGDPDIYRTPYDYRQLARAGVLSNLVDAEVHGERYSGECEVAVLDSCAVFVRRSLLVRCGGWKSSGLPDNTHCSDLWISLMARRFAMATRVVGVRARHTGGGKGEAGLGWLAGVGGDQATHREAHRVIYDQFRDLLPVVTR